MTDDLDDPIDALLSADLDGETTAAEHDRIETDPDLRVRREELRLASDLAGQEPPPLDPSLVDHAVNRALAASPANAADDLATRRVAAGRRRSRRPPPLLVAAAVVLLAAIGIGLIVSAPSSRRSDTAQQRSSSPTERKTADSRTDSEAAAGSATTRPLGFIGDFATPAALRRALTSEVPAGSTAFAAPQASRYSDGQASRCASVVEAHDSRLKPANRQSFAASIAKDPVIVLVYRTKAVAGDRTTTRVVAVGAAACDERVNFER